MGGEALGGEGDRGGNGGAGDQLDGTDSPVAPDSGGGGGGTGRIRVNSDVAPEISGVMSPIFTANGASLGGLPTVEIP